MGFCCYVCAVDGDCSLNYSLIKGIITAHKGLDVTCFLLLTSFRKGCLVIGSFERLHLHHFELAVECIVDVKVGDESESQGRDGAVYSWAVGQSELSRRWDWACNKQLVGVPGLVRVRFVRVVHALLAVVLH